MGNLNCHGVSSDLSPDSQTRREPGLPPFPPQLESTTNQLMELMGEANHLDAARGLKGMQPPNGQDYYQPQHAQRSEYPQGRATTELVNPNPTLETNAIPIACEFPDIFADKPPTMPHPRSVEFAIELKPRARPSRSSHPSMTPEELDQL